MPKSKLIQAGSVVALAGRRIDADGTDPPRFPLKNVPIVRNRLGELLFEEGATALVCSAACGADLVALKAATQLGIRRRIVLPFGRERFLETSVTDRPGEWRSKFECLVSAAEASGDLVVLKGGIRRSNSAAYEAASETILREAQALARAGKAPLSLIAVMVWEGEPRTGKDSTEIFRAQAETAGFGLRIVLTL